MQVKMFKKLLSTGIPGDVGLKIINVVWVAETKGQWGHMNVHKREGWGTASIMAVDRKRNTKKFENQQIS
jgi:hypothetical protein